MAGSNCRLPRCQRKQDTLLNFPESSHNLPYYNNLLPYSKERNLPRFPKNSYIFLAILVPILGAQKTIVNHEKRESQAENPDSPPISGTFHSSATGTTEYPEIVLLA